MLGLVVSKDCGVLKEKRPENSKEIAIFSETIRLV